MIVLSMMVMSIMMITNMEIFVSRKLKNPYLHSMEIGMEIGVKGYICPWIFGIFYNMHLASLFFKRMDTKLSR